MTKGEAGEIDINEIILHFYMNCLADWRKISRFAAFFGLSVTLIIYYGRY